MNIIIANSTSLHKKLEHLLSKQYKSSFVHKKEDLTLDRLEKISPDYIFFLHWSFKIPKEIYEKYTCILFHMTDLPFGRGGSPLQNLIVRGYKDTKLSALRVVEELDAGDIYLKKKLSLRGSADQIFLRADKIVERMIYEILHNKISPVPQKGEITPFKRRTPAESNIQNLSDVVQVYDYIRMLDGEGYPKAYLETSHFKFEFSHARLKSNEIKAYVRIFKK